MTFEEWKTLAKGMRALYTQQNFLPDGESVRTWYMMVRDLPYEAANAAIQKYAATNRFPPTVADIRAQAAEITSGRQSGWGEGWEKTMKAIRKYGYTNPEGALASLDETTRKTVERLGWMELCISENAMADRANFRVIYEQEQVRAKENAALPAGLKTQIAGLQGAAIKALGEAGKGSGEK